MTDLPSTEVDNETLKKEIAKELITEDLKDKKDGFNNIAELFNIFSSAYGDTWTRQYNNDETKDIWALFLWKYDKNIFSKAIFECLKEYTKFPPNLAQFKEICEKINEHKDPKDLESYYKKL